jgi:SAM-dependent methyltransferase
MLSKTASRGRTEGVNGVMRSVLNGIRWALDRSVSVGYGVVYDYIFDLFAPYRALQREVLACIESAAPAGVPRREVRVLEVGCGPGNFSCILAEAGFSVLGMDPYVGLIDLAREKRRARRLGNLAFQQGDLVNGHPVWESGFDQIVSIHTFYAHQAPHRLLREIHRALKPGGHAVIVNHTRRMALAPTFAEVKRREGGLPAVKSLVWLVPNALFEIGRQRVGPYYWDEDTFAREMRQAGFTVREMRRTFLNGTSLLVWARKDSGQ